MSRILRRPMFRGGPVSSYGNGIATGLADGGRVGYNQAGMVLGGDLQKFGTEAYTPEMYNAFMKKMFTNTGNKKTNVPGMFEPDAKKFYNPDGYIEEDFEYENLFKPGESIFSNELFQRADAGIPGALKDRKFSGGENQFATALKKDILKNLPTYEIGGKGGGADLGDELSTAEKLAKERDAKRIQESIDARAEEKNQDIRESDFDAQEFIDKRAEEKNQVGDVLAVTEEADEVVGVQDDPLIPERQGLKEMADEYFQILSGERAERNKKNLREARIADMSDYALKFFSGTQKEGATVGSAAGEVADYATKRPGRVETLKRTQDASDDRLREKGAEFAIRESMSDEKGDLAYQRQRSMLETRLDSAENIAEKNRAAADLRTLNNQAFQRELKQMTIDAKDPQSALEKNVKYLAKKYDVDEKTAYKLYRGDPENFVAQLKADEKAKGFIDDKGFRMAAEEFYGNEFINDITLTESPNVGDPAEGQKDGIYTDSSKRLIIEIKDEVVIKSRSYK
jgi:hypothetical protein